MDILLEVEEMRLFCVVHRKTDYCVKTGDCQKCNRQAQLRKVAAWGEEPCQHRLPDFPTKRKRECSICWQSLLKEAGL